MLTGYIKVDKEAEFTSKDVDACIKKQLDTPKVGHLGTLDPFATGLLICLVGEATKLTCVIDDADKEYVATLKLGITTASLDPETEITETKDVPELTTERIKSVLESFLGRQTQIPPLYSARHVNGTKAYYLAREGKDIQLPPTDIEIKEIDLLSYDSIEHVIVFRTLVSKGTYIRVLGKDIAEKLGTVGHLLALRRTKVGHLTLENSVHCKDASRENLIEMSSLCPTIKKHICDDTMYFRILNGQTIKAKDLREWDDYIFMVYEDRIIALYRKNGYVYKSLKGFRYDD